MSRSNTVRDSLAIIVIWIAGIFAGIIPPTVDQNSGPWYYLGIVLFASVLRLFILFWQTLSHAVKSQDTGWVVGHFLFGAVASLLYYLVTTE